MSKQKDKDQMSDILMGMYLDQIDYNISQLRIVFKDEELFLHKLISALELRTRELKRAQAVNLRTPESSL